MYDTRTNFHTQKTTKIDKKIGKLFTGYVATSASCQTPSMTAAVLWIRIHTGINGINQRQKVLRRKQKSTHSYSQCCGALPFFLGSGSRNFLSAPAPPKKARLRPAPVPKNRFFTKHLKNLSFNNKKASINLDFVPKTGKKFTKYIYRYSVSNFFFFLFDT